MLVLVLGAGWVFLGCMDVNHARTHARSQELELALLAFFFFAFAVFLVVSLQQQKMPQGGQVGRL